MLYWCLLSPTGRRAFLSAYGPVSAEQLLRARVLALMICAVLAYSGQGAHVGEAVAGLDRTVR